MWASAFIVSGPTGLGGLRGRGSKLRQNLPWTVGDVLAKFYQDPFKGVDFCKISNFSSHLLQLLVEDKYTYIKHVTSLHDAKPLLMYVTLRCCYYVMLQHRQTTKNGGLVIPKLLVSTELPYHNGERYRWILGLKVVGSTSMPSLKFFIQISKKNKNPQLINLRNITD